MNDRSSALDHAPKGASGRVLFDRAPWRGPLERPRVRRSYFFPGQESGLALRCLENTMKEQLEQHVKRVKELHELCCGNEQQTKQSLIAPLFAILGYDMTDPRECKPEYRMDFGKGERAATPVDWAFLINGAF